jgi:hypothetical protein
MTNMYVKHTTVVQNSNQRGISPELQHIFTTDTEQNSYIIVPEWLHNSSDHVNDNMGLHVTGPTASVGKSVINL